MLFVNALNKKITYGFRFLTMLLVGLTQINYYAIIELQKVRGTLNFMHSKNVQWE